jgi:hypothetical protein
MAAARRGHVFVLEQHIAGNIWLVHDSNSGRGRTRIHPRSIAGYILALDESAPRGTGSMELQMNSDQIGGLIRAVLSALGGYFVGKGLIDASTMTTLVGAAATILMAGWSAWTNRASGLIASVSAMPSVDSSKLSAAISDPDLKSAAKP